MAEHAARRVVLFDFDGTLFQLGTDWGILRSELEALAGESGIAVNGAGIYELALRLEHDDRVHEAVVSAERRGLQTGRDVEAGLELYRRYAAEDAELAIVTHNTAEVVEAFFEARDLPAPAKVFDRRALGALKEESEAVTPWVEGAQVTVVGDSDHDRRLAERLNADFVDPLQSYYDRKAGELDELAATYENDVPYKRFFYGRRFDAVMDALGAEPGDEVLEVGCGSGYYTRALLARGVRVTATDLSPAYVEQARRLAPGASFGVEDAQRLSFPDARYDRVLMTEVVEHVPNPGGAIAEAARVLRPGGVLALSTPSRRAPMNLAYKLKRRIRRYGVNEHLHEFTPRELRHLIGTRFEVESFERVNAVLPYPLDLLYLRLGSPGLRLLGLVERALSPIGWTMVVRARLR